MRVLAITDLSRRRALDATASGRVFVRSVVRDDFLVRSVGGEVTVGLGSHAGLGCEKVLDRSGATRVKCRVGSRLIVVKGVTLVRVGADM